LLGASREEGGEMGEAAEASKTLHNWMGEPGQGEGRDDEERTLQLCLGLPGGGGGGAAAPAWRRAPGRDKGSHPAAAAAAGSASLLSLGYSNAAFSPCSQGMGIISGSQHHGSILSRQQ